MMNTIRVHGTCGKESTVQRGGGRGGEERGGREGKGELGEGKGDLGEGKGELFRERSRPSRRWWSERGGTAKKLN